MDSPDAFTAIARQAGLMLPATLAAWYRDGLTQGDTHAMALVYDFEWITPEDSQRIIDEWLNPAAQHGNRFFPFAESGAGDAYCLVKLADGREGVAMVWHDDDTSEIAHASFDDFVVAMHLTSYADLSHIGADEAGTLTLIRDSLARSTPALPAAHAEALSAPLAHGVSRQPFRTGPKARPEMVRALLAQDEAESQAQAFTLASPIAFEVVAAWDIES